MHELRGLIGLALQTQGKFTEATTAYREAIRLQPDRATSHDSLGRALEAQGKLDLAKEEVIEEEDEGAQSPTKKNRFSASGGDGQDGMTAVDEGISERSDRIAAKVLQIQQKVESLIDHS